VADKTGGRKDKKGFFSRMLDKLDKQFEKKAKEIKCCGGADKGKGKSCCS